jgi:hypothetical protein
MTLLFADDTQGLDSDKDLCALINRVNNEPKSGLHGSEQTQWL